MGLGEKIKFKGEDREGNPHVYGPASLIDGRNNPEGMYVEIIGDKNQWQSPVDLPLEREEDRWVVVKDIYDDDDECLYEKAQKLYYGVSQYSRPLTALSKLIPRVWVKKITKGFWQTPFGIFDSLETAIKKWYDQHPRTDSIWAIDGEEYLKAWAELDPEVMGWSSACNGRYASLKTVVKLLKNNGSIYLRY